MKTLSQFLEASGPNKTVFNARNRVHSLVHHTTFQKESKARAFADHHRKKGFKTSVRSFRLGPKNHWWQDWSVHIYATDKTPANATVDKELKESDDPVLSALQKLGQEKNFRILQRVASNINTHPDVLNQLADHPHRFVRHNVALNPSSSLSTLKKLMKVNPTDPSHYQANITSDAIMAAQRAYGKDWHLIKESDEYKDLHQAALKQMALKARGPELLRRLANNETTNPDLIHHLVTTRNEHLGSILMSAAHNPSTRVDTLHAIFKRQFELHSSQRSSITDRLVHNRNLPAEILDQMEHPAGVARHPNTEAHTLSRLVKDHNDQSHYGMVMAIVAQHPRTKSEDLEKLSRNYNPQVRLAVAQHPNAPEHVLNRMVKSDPDERVSYHASHSLDKNKI